MVILHGILGSSRNWASAGPALGEHFEVFAPDLPNHGESPGMDDMTFSSISARVVEWLDAEGLDRMILMGHSLGGKVAMRLAEMHPDRVSCLVVVDIAPRDYELHSQPAMEAMMAIDLENLVSRRDAEDALRETVPDTGLRKFLLTNLARDKEGHFSWRVNLSALLDSLPMLARNPLEGRRGFLGPTMLMKGEKSNFVRPKDEAGLRKWFPDSQILTIPDAGHNLHHDNLPAFVNALVRHCGPSVV